MHSAVSTLSTAQRGRISQVAVAKLRLRGHFDTSAAIAGPTPGFRSDRRPDDQRLEDEEARNRFLRAERPCGRDDDMLHRARQRQRHAHTACDAHNGRADTSSLVRIVAALAWASSVPCSAKRRNWTISM